MILKWLIFYRTATIYILFHIGKLNNNFNGIIIAEPITQQVSVYECAYLNRYILTLIFQLSVWPMLVDCFFLSFFCMLSLFNRKRRQLDLLLFSRKPGEIWSEAKNAEESWLFEFLSCRIMHVPVYKYYLLSASPVAPILSATIWNILGTLWWR